MSNVVWENKWTWTWTWFWTPHCQHWQFIPPSLLFYHFWTKKLNNWTFWRLLPSVPTLIDKTVQRLDESDCRHPSLIGVTPKEGTRIKWPQDLIWSGQTGEEPVLMRILSKERQLLLFHFYSTIKYSRVHIISFSTGKHTSLNSNNTHTGNCHMSTLGGRCTCSSYAHFLENICIRFI